MVRQCRRDSERLLLQFSIAISGFTEKSSGRELGLAGLAARATLDASVTSDVPEAHSFKLSTGSTRGRPGTAPSQSACSSETEGSSQRQPRLRQQESPPSGHTPERPARWSCRDDRAALQNLTGFVVGASSLSRRKGVDQPPEQARQTLAPGSDTTTRHESEAGGMTPVPDCFLAQEVRADRRVIAARHGGHTSAAATLVNGYHVIDPGELSSWTVI
jgi:hypothetical protein